MSVAAAMTSVNESASKTRTSANPVPLAADLLATLALAAFSAVVAAGFARVFSGWDFLDELLVLVAVGHGFPLVGRRVGAPTWLVLPITAAVLAWIIGRVHLGDTYRAALPTGESWELLRLELDLVSEQFRTAVAPVAYVGGWAILASIGVALAALLSDTFAFRAYARAESLVPGGVLFVFVAALGTDRLQLALATLLVAAGVIVTVVLRSHHAPRRTATIGAPRRTVTSRIGLVLPGAIVSSLVIALVAGVVGPRLPGAQAEALYDTTGREGGSVTEVLSPLVDIRARLTNRSTTELFAVTATAEAYWRSSALPEFDGDTWGLPERELRRADGTLDVARNGSVELRQSITISGLGGALVPAAADPIAASGADDLRWNADSATLVKTGANLGRGDTFEILSAAPRFTRQALAAATSLDPGDPIYFELPDDFPSSVEETTREIIAESANTYEAALALQNWFRSEFTYSLEIQEGHGNTAIEAFLRNRIGYCEQFAGTFASMLRSVGIPARVAVGFTPGTTTGPNQYAVLGRNAHAWPEVWFDGLGWVPFEPTPGRGAPGAENYTGVPAQQDDGPLDELDQPPVTEPGGVTPPSSLPGDAAATPTLPGQPTPPTTLPDIPTDFENTEAQESGTPGGGPAGDDGPAVPVSTLIVVAVVAVLLTGPALIRRWRRRTTGPPRAELARLWQRAVRAIGDAGVVVTPDLTPAETARLATAGFPTAARPMTALADTVSAATYRPDPESVLAYRDPYGQTAIASCSTWTRQIERAVADSSSPLQRLRRYVTRLD